MEKNVSNFISNLFKFSENCDIINVMGQCVTMLSYSDMFCHVFAEMKRLCHFEGQRTEKYDGNAADRIPE